MTLSEQQISTPYHRQRCQQRSAGRCLVGTLLAVIAMAPSSVGAAGISRERPVALATGISGAFALSGTAAPDGSPLRWRLEARQLTVRLPGSILPGAHGSVAVAAQCGADAARPGPGPNASAHAWAAVTHGSARVAASARVLRLTLARDLAGQTNLCTVTISRTGILLTATATARMHVRRGRVSGCHLGSREHVVLDAAKVRVSVAHADLGAGGGTLDGYRACLKPGGTPRHVDQAGDAGGAGGLRTTTEHFTSAGTWVAWADGYLPHSDLGGEVSWSIHRVDMAIGRPVTIDAGPGYATAVAVAASGVAAWLQEPNQIAGPRTPSGQIESFTFPAAQLRAQRPGAGTVILDQTTPLICSSTCHSAAAITDIAISGQTITWKHAGIPRTATLP